MTEIPENGIETQKAATDQAKLDKVRMMWIPETGLRALSVLLSTRFTYATSE
jgi:hypothetical protein